MHPQPQRVLSEQSTYLVTNILADNTDPARNGIWGPRFQLPDGRCRPPPGDAEDRHNERLP